MRVSRCFQLGTGCFSNTGVSVIIVSINGEERSFEGPMTAQKLLQSLSLDPQKVALERNRQIVPRSTYGAIDIAHGDKLEIVHFVGGGEDQGILDEPLVIAGVRYRSRLIVGTGKYRDFTQTAEAVKASDADRLSRSQKHYLSAQYRRLFYGG